MSNKNIDFSKEVGKVYGNLKILEMRKEKNKVRSCIARCACGVEKEFNYFNLKYEKSVSCGCIGSKKLVEDSTTHGMSYTRLYRIWRNMKTRCYNKKSNRFEIYGGKGIKICADWLESFEAFRDWAMKNGYEEELSIDRMDNNGDYEPTNCRWVDVKTQVRNRSNTWLIKIDGIEKPAATWCEYYGISVRLAHVRKNRGWSDIDCVTTPKLR